MTRTWRHCTSEDRAPVTLVDESYRAQGFDGDQPLYLLSVVIAARSTRSRIARMRAFNSAHNSA